MTKDTLVNQLRKVFFIGISIINLSCNDDGVFPTTNILIVDDERFRINPNSMLINFKPLNENGACETDYLKISFSSDEGDLLRHYFSIAGPSLNNSFSVGEYSINTGCNGAVNFIEYGKTVSEREKYSCQQWSAFGGWQMATCYSYLMVSREEYHFQKDTYHDENLEALFGSGGYKILSVDPATKQISLEFDLSVKFPESQNIKHITGNYTGPYSEDWDIIYYPWQFREQIPVDTCAYMYGYPNVPIGHVLNQTYEINVNGIANTEVVASIQLSDDRTKTCYGNQITLHNGIGFDLWGMVNNNWEIISDTTYQFENSTLNFNTIPNEILVLKYLPKNLVVDEYYRVRLRTSYFVKGFHAGEDFPIDIYTLSTFKVADIPYTCFNDHEEEKYCN